MAVREFSRRDLRMALATDNSSSFRFLVIGWLRTIASIGPFWAEWSAPRNLYRWTRALSPRLVGLPDMPVPDSTFRYAVGLNSQRNTQSNQTTLQQMSNRFTR